MTKYDQIQVYGNNTYTYDDDGYLEEKVTPEGTSNYTYGSLGELREVVTPTQTITYEYNAANQRTAKLIDGVIVEKYLWSDLTTLLALYDKDDNLIQRYEYTDGRVPTSMTQNNTKYYLHYDQVGSLRAVSDISGNIIKEITYDTYGNILSDTNEAFKVPFGFAGGLYDSDTKLTRFGYRDYDAYTGKWTAKDPIDFSGGDTNLYGYVLGDPVNFVDPSGEFGVPGAIAGLIVGAITSFIDPCTGGFKIPSFGDFLLTTVVGGVGGFFGGFFAGSSTVVGIVGGGLGSSLLSAGMNYGLAPTQCNKEPECL